MSRQHGFLISNGRYDIKSYFGSFGTTFSFSSNLASSFC